MIDALSILHVCDSTTRTTEISFVIAIDKTECVHDTPVVAVVMGPCSDWRYDRPTGDVRDSSGSDVKQRGWNAAPARLFRPKLL